MAEHGSSPSAPQHGIEAHNATYQGFLSFSVAGTIVALYIVVALVAFRFIGNPMNLIAGFGGILLGVLTAVIAMRLGGKWAVAVVPLVLFGVFVAANAQMS